MFVLYRKYLICQDIVSAQYLRRIKKNTQIKLLAQIMAESKSHIFCGTGGL